MHRAYAILKAMDPQLQVQPSRPRRVWLWVLVGVVLVLTLGIITLFLWPAQSAMRGTSSQPDYDKTVAPEFEIQTVAAGLDHPWDIAFLPDGRAIFTERSGKVNLLANGTSTIIKKIDDVKVAGEGGLLGLAVDPEVMSNRRIYACYNTTSDVRVVRFELNEAITDMTNKTPIVTGMPSTAGGRHSGCRLAFGPDGNLWVGTGDSAQGFTPQDPKSLGGKILRVDRDGKGVTGNMPAPFDDRIYSYGHRNTQGLAFIDPPIGDVIGYSAEHGSNIDDEVNPLVKGNFGWAPDSGYTEFNIPMTNKTKFPDAVDAIWSSGKPTQAPSGLTQIQGEKWLAWDGALAMAMLKAQHLKILTLDSGGKLAKEEKIITDKGRLRDVERAPDGSLYITTDNGDSDQILRLVVK